MQRIRAAHKALPANTFSWSDELHSVLRELYLNHQRLVSAGEVDTG